MKNLLGTLSRLRRLTGRRSRLILAIVFIFASTTTPALAQELEPLAEVEQRIIRAISEANELLSLSERPRYKLKKIDLVLSLVKGGGLDVGIQIPVLLKGLELSGAYSQINTVKDKYTYLPVADIEIGTPDDFGLLQFVASLQQGLHEAVANAPVVKTSAEHNNEFVVEKSLGGKLSFLGIVAGGVEGKVKNLHSISFQFCLQGSDGECVKED